LDRRPLSAGLRQMDTPRRAEWLHVRHEVRRRGPSRRAPTFSGIVVEQLNSRPLSCLLTQTCCGRHLGRVSARQFVGEIASYRAHTRHTGGRFCLGIVVGVRVVDDQLIHKWPIFIVKPNNDLQAGTPVHAPNGGESGSELKPERFKGSTLQPVACRPLGGPSLGVHGKRMPRPRGIVVRTVMR